MELLQAELNDAAMHRIIALVHDYTGITINASKRDMLQIRLRPRLRHLGLNSYESYIDYLQRHAEEKEFFINRVTTNETQFFRTRRVWEYIQHHYIPQWHEQHPRETLNIWSAAASSGEEAYSLAMSCDAYQKTHAAFQYRIFGTDISTNALGTARSGHYSGRSIEGLKSNYPAHYSEYFTKDAEGSTITPRLQQRVSFKTHSLQNPLPKGDTFSLVLLRNVMIYFSDAMQEQVLQNLARSMQPGAILIIGESESLARIKSPFEYIEPLIYRLPQ
jgi:chemotaxis protein methyltransferase CheR